MQTRRSVITAWLILISCVIGAWADETPPRIKPEEARQHVNRKVEVVFEVKHTKASVHRKTAFLDSEDDFQSEKNLGIAIIEAGLADLKQKRSIEAPADYYHGKTIRVVGTVILKDEKPYIEVSQAEQLDVVPK